MSTARSAYVALAARHGYTPDPSLPLAAAADEAAAFLGALVTFRPAL